MADPLYSSVVSLFHFDGNVPRQFKDYAAAPAAMELASSGILISSLQKKFGDSAGRFTGGYIWLGGVSDSAMAPGASDFCIEGWFYDEGSGNRRVHFGNSGTGGEGATLYVGATTSNTWTVYVKSGGVGVNMTTTGTTPLNTWYHLALVRNGSTLTLYVNGVSVGSASVSGTIPAGGGHFSIGSAGDYLGYGGTYGVQWMGFVDDFRYTIGAARYTGAFTPPSAAFEPNDPMPPTTATYVGVLYRSYGDSLPQSPLNATYTGVYARWETQTTGSGTISGIVTIENIPGSRKVRLYRKQDGMLIRETWSAANGAYSFTNIDPAWEYFVVAHDHLRVYNGVIQDMLVP